ncbi:hypothetical protein ACFLYV_05685 [Chloroflexota bacterium]
MTDSNIIIINTAMIIVNILVFISRHPFDIRILHFTIDTGE